MANSTVTTLGIVRATGDYYNLPQGGEIQTTYNNRGDLAVAQALPPKAELVRLGQTWEVRIATASAFNLPVAMPTTTGALALYNGEAAGGKSYVIDAVWATAIVSSAAITQLVVVAQMQAAVAALTNDTAQLIYSRSGKTAYSGKAKRAVAVGTMVADYWSVLASSAGTAGTATIGVSCYAEVNGGFVVPPGATFGVSCVAGTTAAAGGVMGIVWHEVQLGLG